MRRVIPRITANAHDEAARFARVEYITHLVGVVDALRDLILAAFNRGQYHLYSYQTLVKTPWGEMVVFITTRAKSAFDAERQVIAELRDWKTMRQAELLRGRDHHPWLDQAIQQMEQRPSAHFDSADLPASVHIAWFDAREP